MTPRLRSTCVRPADADDAAQVRRAMDAVDAPHANDPDTTVLVLGQPAFGVLRVHRPGWTILDLWVDADAIDPTIPTQQAATMLLQAAYGMALDAGATCVATTCATAASFDEQMAPAGGRTWRRTVADEPAVRAATSVIPIREAGAGLEVFIQHRVPTMEFVPGAVVFPGGRVEETDVDPLSTDRTHRVAGTRELAEETGARVAPSSLVAWDRWVTPIEWNRRYDVFFYLLPVGDGTAGTLDVEDAGAMGNLSTESHLSEWITLDALVTKVVAGSLLMVPPTRTIVDELQRLGDLASVLDLRPPIAPMRHDLGPRRPRPHHPAPATRPTRG